MTLVEKRGSLRTSERYPGDTHNGLRTDSPPTMVDILRRPDEPPISSPFRRGTDSGQTSATTAKPASVDGSSRRRSLQIQTSIAIPRTRQPSGISSLGMSTTMPRDQDDSRRLRDLLNTVDESETNNVIKMTRQISQISTELDKAHGRVGSASSDTERSSSRSPELQKIEPVLDLDTSMSKDAAVHSRQLKEQLEKKYNQIYKIVNSNVDYNPLETIRSRNVAEKTRWKSLAAKQKDSAWKVDPMELELAASASNNPSKQHSRSESADSSQSKDSGKSKPWSFLFSKFKRKSSKSIDSSPEPPPSNLVQITEATADIEPVAEATKAYETSGASSYLSPKSEHLSALSLDSKSAKSIKSVKSNKSLKTQEGSFVTSPASSTLLSPTMDNRVHEMPAALKTGMFHRRGSSMIPDLRQFQRSSGTSSTSPTSPIDEHNSDAEPKRKNLDKFKKKLRATLRRSGSADSFDFLDSPETDFSDEDGPRRRLAVRSGARYKMFTLNDGSPKKLSRQKNEEDLKAIRLKRNGDLLDRLIKEHSAATRNDFDPLEAWLKPKEKQRRIWGRHRRKKVAIYEGALDIVSPKVDEMSRIRDEIVAEAGLCFKHCEELETLQVKFATDHGAFLRNIQDLSETLSSLLEQDIVDNETQQAKMSETISRSMRTLSEIYVKVNDTLLPQLKHLKTMCGDLTTNSQNSGKGMAEVGYTVLAIVLSVGASLLWWFSLFYKVFRVLLWGNLIRTDSPQENNDEASDTEDVAASAVAHPSYLRGRRASLMPKGET